jgi:N-acetylglucosamine kinase-like BadF-type ATPase
MTAGVFLGVDAGASQTTVVLVGADRVERGRAEGPGSAVRPGESARSAAVILEIARRAGGGEEAPLPAARAVVGAAGAGRAGEREALSAALERAGLAHRARVLGDVELALLAAFDDGPGIVVAAGTGSAAFARGPDGALRRAGGYGWQLSDEGGGYWLGRRALGLAARDQDGVGERTTLPTRILAALDLREFDDLVRWAATATPPQVAALAPSLLAAARDGELSARAVLVEAAVALAALAAGLARDFPGTGPIPVALTGGLLAATSPLRTITIEALRPALPRAAVRAEPLDPALHAARMAAAE